MRMTMMDLGRRLVILVIGTFSIVLVLIIMIGELSVDTKLIHYTIVIVLAILVRGGKFVNG